MPDNLDKVDHIIVLMMENRSFDHMLGYLRRSRPDVEGLTGTEQNEFRGQIYSVNHLRDTVVPYSPAHWGAAVETQISGGTMAHFVQSFYDDALKTHVPPNAVNDRLLGLVMGYYTEQETPVYSYLAQQYVICDHWFSSVPGATWPNRLYSLTGSSDGKRDNPSLDLSRVPGYKLKSVFDIFDARGLDWAAFYSDVPFPLVFKRIAQNAADTRRIRRIDNPKEGFFARARIGLLPPLTWLEPNYTDYPLGAPANDDLAPADIRNGQAFVKSVYDALRASPVWGRSLLIITYDEHGGFYDHVPPPAAPDRQIPQYGVRVPAFVISPWVPKGVVVSAVFDHCSILRTVLLRFAPEEIANVGERVANVNDLWPLLSLPIARTDAESITTNVETGQQRLPDVRLSDFGDTLRRVIFGFPPAPEN